MKIKGLTLEQIQSAAKEAGYFRLDNIRSQGNYHFFALRMASGTPQHCGNVSDHEGYFCTRKRNHEGDHVARTPTGVAAFRWGSHEGSESNIMRTIMRYRKRGLGNMAHGRGPEFGIAVCFHGFEAFMRACFARNEKTIIRTCRAAYLGLEDFEEKYPAVGSQNIGSQFCPIQYREACDC